MEAFGDGDELTLSAIRTMVLFLFCSCQLIDSIWNRKNYYTETDLHMHKVLGRRPLRKRLHRERVHAKPENCRLKMQ